jgi:tRNA/rRNA methyltransferase
MGMGSPNKRLFGLLYWVAYKKIQWCTSLIKATYTVFMLPAIVLVSPKGPDNIGSVARAMKNFGLSDLRIVAPRCSLEDARKMAVHAFDVIETSSQHATLLEAVNECDFVVGTTARFRKDFPEMTTPRQVAAKVLSHHQPAIVFGREEHGLFNDELELCHALLSIPTGSQYPVLNLAQAVQVVVYELLLAREQTALERPPLAPRHVLEGMYAHLLEFMLEVGYTDSERQDHALRRFRGILSRADLSEHDVAFVRGLLSQGLWASRKARGLDTPGTVPYPRLEQEL